MNQLQTPQDWQTLAAAILATCKRLNPNFHNPNPEMTQAWAYALQNHSPLKPHNWPELAEAYLHATITWHTHDTTGQRPTIGQIIHTTQQTLNQWQTHPTYKQAKQKLQATAQKQRDHNIQNGLPPNQTRTLPAEIHKRLDEYVNLCAPAHEITPLEADLTDLTPARPPEDADAELGPQNEK